MGFFNNALSVFSDFGSKSINDLYKEINRNALNYNFDRTFKEIAKQTDKIFEQGKSFASDFGSYIKEVHDNLADFQVEVPYNKETDTIKFVTEGNQFTVTVETNDKTAHNEITTTLPSNVIADKMYKKYDKDKHVLTFIFPKDKDIKAILKTDKVSELINSYKENKGKLATKFYNDLKNVVGDIADEIVSRLDGDDDEDAHYVDDDDDTVYEVEVPEEKETVSTDEKPVTKNSKPHRFKKRVFKNGKPMNIKFKDND